MSDAPRPGASARPEAIRKAWRAAGASLEGVAPDLTVGLVASFTAEPMVPFVGAPLVEAGLRPALPVAPYNQIFQVALDPAAHFASAPDVLAVLWRIEDLCPVDLDSFAHGDEAAGARVLQTVDALGQAMATLREGFAGTLIVALPPFPHLGTAALDDLDNATGLGALHREAIRRFTAAVAEVRDLRWLDLDAVERQVGSAAAYDARQWYLYRQPFSAAFMAEAGRTLARVVIAARVASKKCVVLDCDNTLWGGVVGEDGIDGIQLGQDFPGAAYRDLQRLLLRWRSQGVFLALASKNNEEDVWEVFDRHDGMLLKREHISSWRINWRPKADNLPEIARELNIGIDSLVFVDDNPMETAHVAGAWPEVTCVTLPEEPAEIFATLRSLKLFDRLDVTDEDRQRADMMRAERDRETLGSRMSKEAFLAGLDLQIELFRAASADLGRIAQLVNKTNQFNLTTVRRTLDEVRALAASASHRVYGLKVADRFGRYGLTGVVIVEIVEDGAVWRIDTLLMSCRVLGRSVESALLAALAADAAAAGADTLEAAFVPTRKNALCESYLPDQGFRPLGDGRWRLAVADAPAMPGFVRRATADATAGDATTGERAA